MYKVHGLVFELTERQEEAIQFQEPETWAKLKQHRIPDNTLYLNYDDVLRLFDKNHTTGRSFEELIQAKKKLEENNKNFLQQSTKQGKR